jgi:amidase
LMGVQGPLARSATDLELLFDVIAGPCIGEDAGWKLALPESRGAQLEHFRVAVMPPMPWVKAASEMHGKVDELARFLSQRGAKVAQAMPDLDFEQYFRDYLCLLMVTTSQGQTRAEREAAAAAFSRGSSLKNRGKTLMASKLSTVSDTDLDDLLTDTLGAEARDRALSAQAEGFVIDAAGYLALVRRREVARAAWRSFFKDWDVLIGPMTLDAAFEHKTGAFSERTLQIDNETVPYVINLVYPMWAIFAGQPSTAFPAGLNRAGLPLGLQAIGPYLEDRTTLRFAQLLEREWQGFVPPPGY